jgi:hypothetical protein
MGWEDVVAGPVGACDCPRATLAESRATRSRATIRGIRSYGLVAASESIVTRRDLGRRQRGFGGCVMAAWSRSRQS